ncbi:MAG: c-type cytochrome [Rhodospirillales bacterium]|nr:c-type cytochrome [Rhodospirillales bacterium]
MHRFFLSALGLLVAGNAQAGEPARPSAMSGSPAALAGTCFNCHGTEGRTSAAIPGLAGLEKDYLATALKAYKDGSREATIMHQLAKGYTDEEILALADYFSQVKP